MKDESRKDNQFIMYEYIEVNKLLALVDSFDKEGQWKAQRALFHQIIDDPKNVWYQYIMDLYQDIDQEAG